MRFLAAFFKLLFKLPLMRKYYFGLYKKVFDPLALFKGLQLYCDYDEGLRICLKPDDWIQQQIYFFGAYDERGIAFLKKHLKEGDVMIDGGANIGSYTLIASRLAGDEGRVIAFEPVSAAFRHLRHNISINALNNITAEQKALYHSTAEITLHVAGSDNTGMSSIKRHEAESGIIESALAVALDDYLKEASVSKVDLIKLDIEGAELNALKGMEETLKSYRPIILIELNEQSGYNDRDEIVAFLTDLEYEQFAIGKDGNIAGMDQGDGGYRNFVFRVGSTSGHK